MANARHVKEAAARVNQFRPRGSTPGTPATFALETRLHDDLAVDRRLGRRQALALIGGAGLALLARPRRAHAENGASTPSCTARPQQTAGPFFVDEALDRSDIRSDPATGALSPGAPLRLSFRVSRVAGGACAPLPGATIDIWQCDAAGRYSDVRDWTGSTVGQKFLRGYQTTDAAGGASFLTIYPGWYEGRAVHVHFKIRSLAPGGHREFISQLYFDDALSDRVFASAWYRPAAAQHRMRNERDGLFRAGGRQLMLDVREQADGYAATFDIGLDV
jgi:protocatechuate 3,4-dioxygenase beta subunit